MISMKQNHNYIQLKDVFKLFYTTLSNMCNLHQQRRYISQMLEGRDTSPAAAVVV